MPRNPKQPLLFGCEEPNCTAVSRTAAGIWESYNAQTVKAGRYRHPHPTLNVQLVQRAIDGMPLETQWPWAVRSLELQPSAAHCHGQAGYCGSAASGYHCRSSTQTGKMRVPASREGLHCHLAKWAWSDLGPSAASKGNYPKATIFFGMVSAKLWKLSGSRCHQHSSLTCSVSQ